MKTLPLDLLERVPLFAGLDDRARKSLASMLSERPFHPGDTIAAEGAGGVGFFVVDAGQLEVTIAGERRRTLGPGDWFGEIALIDGGTRTATVTALTDGIAYGLTSWQFRPFVEENPSVAWPLLEALASRIRDAERHAA